MTNNEKKKAKALQKKNAIRLTHSKKIRKRKRLAGAYQRVLKMLISLRIYHTVRR